MPELPAAAAGLLAEATACAARFDADLARCGPGVSAALAHVEAAASSVIEGIEAAARDTALAALGRSTTTAGQLVAANEHAVRAAAATIEPPTAADIRAWHAALLGKTAPEVAGRWRDQQVWIGGLSPSSAVFVPPHQNRISEAVADLVRFIERTDIPAIAHAAITHAHFETIHPFADGNGRTGRALVHAQLRNAGLATAGVVPVSAHLAWNRHRYYNALSAYRDGDLAGILELFGEAFVTGVELGRELLGELDGVRQRWCDRVHARRDAAVWKVVDLLLGSGRVDGPAVAAQLGAAPQNAYRALRPLIDAGVLVEATGFRRRRVWLAPDVLEVFDRLTPRLRSW